VTGADREPIVALDAVTYRYRGGGGGVEDVTLEVPRGRRLAVVGPNGSGKTTLLRLLSGSLLPQRGTVRVCGDNPAAAGRACLARKVAVVGPQTQLGFPYTVVEVVLMGRAPHLEGFRLESARDLEVAREVMVATDVLRFADRPFDTLSSGERQRVSVARALAQEPDLLLLDEPGAFLDIKQASALYELLEDRNRGTGLTVISVLHDLNLASHYFHEVAMFAGGSLQAIGAPEDVMTYARIREVFDTDVYVDLNDLTGKLNILPLPRSRNA
jgi:iron complex transport system ATP-binding protein